MLPTLPVMVINAQNGVEVGTEIAWRNTTRHAVPVLFAVNHLEHENSNFDETLRQLKTQFGNRVTVLQYPLNPGLGFNAVIDLMKMKMLKYKEDGGKPEILDIPDSEKDKAESLYNQLVENAAENDETLMEAFFENGSLTPEQLIKGTENRID